LIACRLIQTARDRVHEIQQFFSNTASEEERSLFNRIQQEFGGIDACLKDDGKLQRLIQADCVVVNESDGGGQDRDPRRTQRGIDRELKELKEELREDLNYAIAKNERLFLGKFQMMEDRFRETVKAIEGTGDRVIEAFNKGPSNSIHDPVSVSTVIARLFSTNRLLDRLSISCGWLTFVVLRNHMVGI
jgi:hypothetical protein